MARTQLQNIELANSTLVIKLSGKNIDDDACLEDISRQAVALQQAGAKVMLVHGGGMRINQALKDAGISPKFHQGQRITDDATMNIVSRVLCNEINIEVANAIRNHGGEVIYGKQTQILLSAPLIDNQGINNQGINKQGIDKQGIDKQGIDKQGIDKQGIDKQGADKQESGDKNDAKSIALGRVGKVVDTKPIVGLKNQIAVMAPVANDAINGLEYNVNADLAAAAIAVSYKANYLFYMTDQDGVLDEKYEVINQISKEQIDELIEQGIVTDGMIPKIISMRDALTQGVKRIVVANGATPDIICSILGGSKAGTSIY